MCERDIAHILALLQFPDGPRLDRCQAHPGQTGPFPRHIGHHIDSESRRLAGARSDLTAPIGVGAAQKTCLDGNFTVRGSREHAHAECRTASPAGDNAGSPR